VVAILYNAFTARKTVSVLGITIGVLIMAIMPWINQKEARPLILTVTDSIGIGWRPELESILSPDVDVRRIPQNARDTGLTLARIDEWVGKQRPDIILWNNGLHDLQVSEVGGSSKRTPQGLYEQNLHAIADRLRSTGAKVFFLTTTPVEPWNDQRRSPGDVTIYNEIAIEVMKAQGIQIIDLNSFISENQIPHGDDGKNGLDGVHFDKEAYRDMAHFIFQSMHIGSF
jgi:lysophospholipase L1-like esterase